MAIALNHPCFFVLHGPVVHLPVQSSETALHTASTYGHSEVCRVLIEAKASVNAVSEVGRYRVGEINGKAMGR